MDLYSLTKYQIYLQEKSHNHQRIFWCARHKFLQKINWITGISLLLALLYLPATIRQGILSMFRSKPSWCSINGSISYIDPNFHRRYVIDPPVWWVYWNGITSSKILTNIWQRCVDALLWPQWRLNSQAWRLFTQAFIQAQIKENIKAPRHWPLCGEFTGTSEFSAQMASNKENVSIWWRHHGVATVANLLFQVV